jgi:hypothetical protein
VAPPHLYRVDISPIPLKIGRLRRRARRGIFGFRSRLLYDLIITTGTLDPEWMGDSFILRSLMPIFIALWHA